MTEAPIVARTDSIPSRSQIQFPQIPEPRWLVSTASEADLLASQDFDRGLIFTQQELLDMIRPKETPFATKSSSKPIFAGFSSSSVSLALKSVP